MTLRIGHITYANCTPLFQSLSDHYSCNNYSFLTGPPAKLNSLLRKGEIDVCPSSSIEYALFPHDYVIFPDLSISARGAVKSVLLFSNVPLPELAGKTVGLTVESDTSIRLLEIVLNHFHGLNASFERFPGAPAAGLARFPALLLIGDSALKEAGKSAAKYVYDLGEEWFRHTGLPFVFALWLVRRDALVQRKGEVACLHRDLLAAKNRSYAAYEDIARTAPEAAWLDQASLVDYWRTISYDLGVPEFQGLQLFYRYAFERKLIDALPDLNLFQQ